METVHEQNDAGTKISIIGKIDTLSAPELERELTGLLDGGARNLLLDLGKTDYLSSAGVRTFLRIARRLEKEGGALKFQQVEGMVREVFKLTGIDQIFDLDAEPAP